MKGQHPTGLTEVRAVRIQLKLFSHPDLQLLPGLRFPCETWMWWFISLINDLKFSFTGAVSVHESASLEILKALECKILTITCCVIAGVLEWREEPKAAVVGKKRISGKSESCEPSSGAAQMDVNLRWAPSQRMCGQRQGREENQCSVRGESCASCLSYLEHRREGDP